jgi:hypothetical protein
MNTESESSKIKQNTEIPFTDLDLANKMKTNHIENIWKEITSRETWKKSTKTPKFHEPIWIWPTKWKRITWKIYGRKSAEVGERR